MNGWGGWATAISEAQKRAVAKYRKNNYERLSIEFKKGLKEIYASHAASQGESLNAFTSRAMSETMARDREVGASQVAQAGDGNSENSAESGG
jgi:hypothetical protein